MKQFSEISFPVYRCYKNRLSWFRIDSPESFEEIRVMGSQLIRMQHTAKILPDRNLIYDLVFAYQDYADAISADDYALIAQKAG